MRSITLVFALLICAVFLLPAGSGETVAPALGLPLPQAAPAPEQEPAPAPDPAPDAGPPRLTWAELVERPRDFLDEPVRIRVQLESLPETWNPLATRFARAEWICARAWSDEQMPWFEATYAAPSVRLFARRGSAVALQLTRAKRYERFEVVAVVRELMGRRPWVEVRSMLRLPQEMPEGTVLHAGRAVRLMHEAKWQLALTELERAAQAPLPDHARDNLRYLAAICEREQAKGEKQ